MLPLPFTAASISLGYGAVDGKYYTASSPHLGMDFSSRSRGVVAGAVIRASGAGKVVRSGVGPIGVSPTITRPNNLSGNSIDVDYGGDFITRYMHRPYDSPSPQKDDRVVEGSVLGVIGNTGLSGGAHLHMETWDKRTGRRVNPALFFDFTRTVTSGSTAGGATPFDPEEDDMTPEQAADLAAARADARDAKTLANEIRGILYSAGLGEIRQMVGTTNQAIYSVADGTPNTWDGLNVIASRILAEVSASDARDAARDAALTAAVQAISTGQGVDPAVLAQTVTDAAKAGAVAALGSVRFPDAAAIAQQVITQQERARLAELQAEVERLTAELAKAGII